MKPLLLLVDGYSLIYRAFFAIRELTGPDGQPVNAVYGFTKMLRKLLAERRPTHVAVVLDLGAPQRRLTILDTYKAQRPPTPPALAQQLPVIRSVLQALRLPVVAVEGEEADDIIGTLSIRAARDEAEVLIVSNDKDFLQLVGPRIRLLRPDSKESVVMDAVAVVAKLGIRPDQIVDYLSLVGDAVDNIPGVPGIGEKTAAELLRQYDSVENLLTCLADVPRPKLREALTIHADRFRANRTLVALHTDLSLPVTWPELAVQPADTGQLLVLYRQFGFKTLAAQIEEEATDLFGGR
jgi:DNA polymerase-1